ncbi:MAG: aminopeptidase P family protein [Spirochaetes bacterium]|nr:aminopeptidase P family protein [Spirochaetota bacterium]MBU0956297.1 aminopeptidase P family protein [Spirochaetota bacterium]
MFDSSVYKARRTALCAGLQKLGVDSGLILLPGNVESPMNYADNTYRYRQDSSFLYCVGLQEPGLAATIDVASGRCCLFADELSMDMLVWTGPRPSAAEYAAACAADELRPVSALADVLAAAGSSPLFLPPYRAETQYWLEDLTGIEQVRLREEASLPLIQAMVELREIKEDREIVEIEKAVDTTIAMHRAVMASVGPGVSEAELMATAYRVALAGGGMPSFPPIATTRGAVLHNHGYDGVCRSGQLFLLDAGAETPMGYAGDLTSTFPVSGRYDSRQRAIYELVLAAGSTAASMLKPGLSFRQAHLAAAATIVRGLQALGLMRGDVEAAVEAGAHALFFPHGLGHQMGLDVHDMEALGELHVGYDSQPRSTQFGLKSLRLAKALRPGMVLTVEPGIYFIEGLWRKWRADGLHSEFINYDEAGKWMDFGGVRNEEDWLITADGARRLGGSFDKSLAAMEAGLGRA